MAVHGKIAVISSDYTMRSPCIASPPTSQKPCQCHAQLFRGKTLFKSPLRTVCGYDTKRQGNRVALVCAVQRNSPPVTSSTTDTKSQPAASVPPYSSGARSKSAASSGLVQVLAGSVIAQGFRQLQDTVDQLQQAGNKLTKGFSPRPLGYPPGAVFTVV